ncbi:MAG: flagellar motor switch protein FliG [Spirochaetaceae bacterium]
MDPNEERLRAYRKGKGKGFERAGDPDDTDSKERSHSTSPSKKKQSQRGSADDAGGEAARRRVEGGDGESGLQPTSAVPSGFEKTVSEEGLDKAARLLVALGTDRASEVLKHLPEDQIEALMARVAATKTVRRGEVEHWLRSVPKRDSGDLKAGPGVASQMLEAAFGKERAGEFMKLVRRRRGEKRFAFLGEIEPQQIVTLLRGESDPVISVVLSNMPSEQAAQVLSRLPEDTKQRIGVRMARMEEVSTDTLDRIEEGLRTRIETQGRVISEEVDGREALARILRFMNVRDEDYILSDLAESDPQLSADVRDRLFTIDTLEYIDDRDLSKVLREFDDRSIALLLKGKEEKIRSRILHSVSERRREIISEEYAHLGPVRKSDADTAATEFLRYLQRLEEEGALVVRRPDEEYL